MNNTNPPKYGSNNFLYAAMSDKKLVDLDAVKKYANTCKPIVVWATILLNGLSLFGCHATLDRQLFEPWIQSQLDTDAPTTRHLSFDQAQRSKNHQPRFDPISIPANANAEDYVRLALQRNPQISAAQQRVERLKYQGIQADSWDDPLFTVAAGEMAQTAAGQVELIAGISQRIPIPGTIQAKRGIADQDIATANAQLQRTKMRIAREVRRAYWSYYLSHTAVEITKQSRVLLDQFRAIAQSKLKAGQADQQDVLHANVELAHLDKEIVQHHQRRITAQAMINTLLDRAVNANLPPPPHPQSRNLTIDLHSLLDEASRMNPDLWIAQAQLETFRKHLRLAQLDDQPAVTVGVHYAAVDHDGLSGVANGDDQWWVTLGLKLPLASGRRHAAKHQAIRAIAEAAENCRKVKNQVALRVQDAFARFDSHHTQIQLIEKQIIPEAKQAVDVSLVGYQAGKIDFLTLTDSWQKLLRFELMRQQDRVQLEHAYADLLEAIGREFSLSQQDLSKGYHATPKDDTK